MTTISAASYRSSSPKRSKYGNKKVTIDGVSYDSKREAAYGQELRLREKAGEVGGVELQKVFPLFTPGGFVVGAYRADFAFWDHQQDRFRVIDVKGVDTPLSKWKRKHVKGQYGIDVEVVR